MAKPTNIVVTGDDFGKSEDVNNAVEFCHKNGILTSTSLVATGDAFDGAVIISKRNPTLGVGVHLAIEEFDSLSGLPSTIIDPLTNKFYSYADALKSVATFKYKKPDLVKEYSLQIERVLDCGIPITHLDHHHHLHLYWPVLSAMIRVAKHYNIRYIRSQVMLVSKKQTLHKKIYRAFHQRYLKGRIGTSDGYFDLVHSEFETMYSRLVRLVTSNYRVAEIVAHPCMEKEYEKSFLTDEKVIHLVKSCNLVSFGNIRTLCKT